MPLSRRAITMLLLAVTLVLGGCATSNPVIGDPSGTTTTTGVGA